MKMFFMGILLMLSFNAVAQEGPVTGIFMDDDRYGEGIVTIARDSTHVTYFFTYGAIHCPFIDGKPEVGPEVELEDCNRNGQRWYLMSDKWNPETNEVSGFIYKTRGLKFPNGDPDPVNPFGVLIGEEQAVGYYAMRRQGEGYQMLVVPFGGILLPNDELFHRIFHFEIPVFMPYQEAIPE